jgi:hypothetical protein
VGKSENKERDIREAVKKELTVREEEVKKLKDTILKLKVEKNEANSVSFGILNMSIMRDEMKAADSFIRTVMKDNLLNYSITEKIVKEDSKMRKVSSEERRVADMKFKIEALEKINKANCGCQSCVMNRSYMLKKVGSKNRVVTKEMLISDGIMMSLDFKGGILDLDTFLKDEKMKEIRFKDKINRETMVKISLVWKKDFVASSDKIKFNMHLDHGYSFEFDTEDGSSLEKVSLSSVLVVKAMREVKDTEPMIFPQSVSLMDGTIKMVNCFCQTMLLGLGIKLSNEWATKISDMTEEEEALFLTKMGDINIYFFMKEGEKNNLANHISLDQFENPPR